MLTLERTIDIPANRHLNLDLPDYVPSGRVTLLLAITPYSEMNATQLDAIDPLLQVRAKWKGKPIFGEDGLTYQKNCRNEWNG